MCRIFQLVQAVTSWLTVIRRILKPVFIYSVHADQKELLNFIKPKWHEPKYLRIVYGDDGAKGGLQRQYL